MDRSKVLLIYTGGTIGMHIRPGESSLMPFNFEGIWERMPELQRTNCIIESVSTGDPIDSSDMHPDKWIEIAQVIKANYSNYDGFVVLHGSDTMAYTASGLSFLLENLSKPVILTGSQLPIGVPRTDARENLITSIEIAGHKDEDGNPSVPEVAIYFEYHLLRGNRAHKFHSEHFHAIRSPNYPSLAEAGVHLKFNQPFIRQVSGKDLIVHGKVGLNIQILKLYPGIQGKNIEAIREVPETEVLLLETYGSGNAPTNKEFIDALKRMIDKGIHVLNVSQCSAGRVVQGKYQASKALDEIGVLSAGDMIFEAALTKSMFLLGQDLVYDAFRDQFLLDLRGEGSA
jgi:L-asparaginase